MAGRPIIKNLPAKRLARIYPNTRFKLLRKDREEYNMNGFITESASKISDGIFNAIKLLLFYALTSLLLVPVEYYFHRPGMLIYIFLLLAVAGFYLQRALTVRISDPLRAWYGMEAGLLFWQVIRFTADLGSIQIFQQTGMIFFVMVVIITVTLWKKILPIGVRSAMAVMLICWLGKLYQMGYTYLINWPPFVYFSYESLRFFAGGAGLVALLFIIYRSRDLNSRIYGAIIVFASVLFVALAF